MKAVVKIIGAGLAGSEAAWQCAHRGIEVDLYEMRPVRSTPAHQTSDFSELVCSNSLKSESENTAPWVLKEEMRRAGSLLIDIAKQCSVPAGHALAVDRTEFSQTVTERISSEPLIHVHREEVTHIDEDEITIVATGPLTSDALAEEIARLSTPRVDRTFVSDPGSCSPASRTEPALSLSKGMFDPHEPSDNRPGEGPAPPQPDATSPTGALSSQLERTSRAGAPAPHRLYFYDSISPIVEADSIDMSRVYLAARYDKGSADYINCPMTKEEYDRFYDSLVAAESVEQKDWEKLNYFEACLPIEEIARRGRDTLRFGPMKPVGLRDPRTGKPPYAVVQLRQANPRADSYNLVGFQNHLKYGEQAHVLRLIPGLGNARFLRFGQIHRNTYINSPTLLTETQQMKVHPSVFFAGQICGVEGYVESIATGLLAGIHAAALMENRTPLAPPRASALGSLVHYITHADAGKFQPANITFDLLPPLDKKVRDRQLRHRLQCERALNDLQHWLHSQDRGVLKTAFESAGHTSS